MKKIKVLEVSEVDLLGRIFNGYDFTIDLNKDLFDVKQVVISKLSKDKNVINLLDDTSKSSLFYKFLKYEENKSVHNLISITTPLLTLTNEYKQADIIHFHMFHNAKLSIPSILNISKEKKVIITLHDPWFLTGKCVHFYDCNKWEYGCNNCERLNELFPLNNDNTNYLWNIKKKTFNDSNIDVVVASKWMYDLAKKSCFFNKNTKIHLIPFGIQINDKLNRNDILKEYKIPVDNKVIFLRAQPDFKGTKYALEALKKINLKNITILTCSNKNMMDSLKNKYQVIDLGYVSEEEIEKAFTSCDIFLSPSSGESFGVMIVKSMLHKKPVIVFNNTSMPSVANAPKCGYLVKDKDANGLAKAIEVLINDEQEYKKRAKLCYDFANDNYKKEEYINKIEKLYIDVYNKKSINKKNNYSYDKNIYNNFVKSLKHYIQNDEIDDFDLTSIQQYEIYWKANQYICKYLKNYYKPSLKDVIKVKLYKNKVYNMLRNNKLIYKIYKKIRRR